MPRIQGVMYVGLSVTDVRRSADWYRDVLGLDVERERFAQDGASWDEVLLRDPTTGLLLGLLQHPQNEGQPFSEFRTGLDHVEFEVGTMDELDEWRDLLDARGIRWSGARPHIVTFRDPDNIQLEFFCRHEADARQT
jgi:glyoxylase I family protein